jgi:hypothetical protein
MGVAVGGYNNDGFADMFVSTYGRYTFYHNNGNRTFSDVREKRAWSSRMGDQQKIFSNSE